MLEWIADNKTWLFSGVGLTIISCIGWLFFPSRGGNSQKQKGGDGSINIQAGQDANVGDIGKTPGDEK